MAIYCYKLAQVILTTIGKIKALAYTLDMELTGFFSQTHKNKFYVSLFDFVFQLRAVREKTKQRRF